MSKERTECNHDWIVEINASDNYKDEHGNECYMVRRYCSKCGSIDVTNHQFGT